jgi:hypothetical protein
LHRPNRPGRKNKPAASELAESVGLAEAHRENQNIGCAVLGTSAPAQRVGGIGPRARPHQRFGFHVRVDLVSSLKNDEARGRSRLAERIGTQAQRLGVCGSGEEGLRCCDRHGPPRRM